ncbi:haloacid dehalogenase [Candidatus Desantisbacteria bacterium CG1_02_38_46]|uniref:Haloacid dehalogenase n=3 Tax=unclassified Candidatus Desantisiibacteriota TaxID=3106372 RepID=A0A2H9PBH5_9BACT|nr:MAG: haloacid dehalogenase [Candidatus Desantisbacteria bacterium CG1_02_38_46]PIU52062.1 MAG: haloacid dehalogenase [Candidatus Desantisbacteria bacterium CG07_land_8_20_14_0_80_39_15]PIZ16130.1 MAG: haloacid dehalogenase [Candidatus Desantisbacteria bacterium CG_4_10_14_0_8_um_filter_39_17]
MSDPTLVFKNFKPTREFLVGIDSDGCAFDTMEIKHKECFIPNIIKYFGLQKVSKYARDAAEFVNLYSKSRGANRFIALIEVFDLLRERKEVLMRNAEIPQAQPLRDWIKKESKLGNPTLRKYVQENNDQFMKKTLEWSEAVNNTVENIVQGVPPFPFVRESLEKLFLKADIVIVSATPQQALEREWKEHGVDKYVALIVGQEVGSKSEILNYVGKGKYAKDKVLMVGDAPGDLKAARENQVLFFPVNSGHEEDSWEKFYKEVLDKFLSGIYAGDYEKALIEEFNKYLPELPPWKK